MNRSSSAGRMPCGQAPLLKCRRTKIVATLGPASASEAMVGSMLAAGVNVFRLNMSHGSQADHAAAAQAIRAQASRRGQAVAILADLCGPKIRVGDLAAGELILEVGQRLVLSGREGLWDAVDVPCHYPHLAEDVGVGDRILLDDGLIALVVRSVDDGKVVCEVLEGGCLRSRKGMNLPGVALSTPSLTAKDREDVAFVADLGVDYVALSFVRQAEDVRELRALLLRLGSDAGVVAKIEKPEALQEIDAILAVADAIMVARGDLGVEVDPERVPLIQDDLVLRARAANRPVIVATQMLESMIGHSRPTRAEVGDVAHAVQSGADAVMLSGETAVGRFPLEAVRMMDRIARRTEAAQWSRGRFHFLTPSQQPDVAMAQSMPQSMPLGESVARAAASLSRDLLVRALCVVCHTGLSVTVVSAARPAAPIIALCDSERVGARMCLLWGVLPEFASEAEDAAVVVALAREAVAAYGLGQAGDHALLIQGFHVDPSLSQPSVSVLPLLVGSLVEES